MEVAEYAELEIGLRRGENADYNVELRFSDPVSQADTWIGFERGYTARFDHEQLARLSHDPALYGAALTEGLFIEPSVRSSFEAARAVAGAREVALRIRLAMGTGDLHALHWETLLDPQSQTPLATSDRIRFSRYPLSDEFEPVKVRSKGELSALVVVANPPDLAEYGLAAVDQSDEINSAKGALSGIEISVLPSEGKSASLQNLIDELREHEYDIVYLVCHGSLVAGQPWLWMEHETGQDARTSGIDLVTKLKELTTRPRLFVLASCESAGASEGDALSAIGPRLAGSGIPAVLAMQGKIQMDTVARFMPIFFEQLLEDGEIDRAVAHARGAVSDRPDSWMPALYMRLKSGRIWYVPGFGPAKDEFKKWIALRSSLNQKRCTPILGPGLSEEMIGSRREVARRWAEIHGFPMSGTDRDVLYRVAQYVLTTQSRSVLPSAHREMLRDTLAHVYSDLIDPDLLKTSPWNPEQLAKALETMTDRYLTQYPDNIHLQLARLRQPLYIVTSPYDIMFQALKRQDGVTPERRVCPWNNLIDKEQVLYEDEITAERPLVYHLFGHLDVEHSLVYSEDDYFDFLIGTTRDHDLIPGAVREALTNSSLLFLGFGLEDREFRVFFRFIMAQEGRRLLREFSHAAVQVDPAEDSILDVRRAHDFLEEYYDNENIDTYWGSADEFMKELATHP